MGTRDVRAGLLVAAGLVLLAAFALVPGIASASGGGGCGRPVTDDAGTTVEIRSFCFTPTILRVAPGEAVTFANRDAASHTVLGANGAWGGYDVLKRGSDVTYGFAEPGVYPYACTYHPGMVGVVVVGDGAGGAIETTTAAGPVTQASSLEHEVASAEKTPTRVVDRGAWPALAAASFGLLLMTIGGIAIQRLRRS